MPLFIGLVVLVSALLLLVVFRSLLIPLQAAFMNLLSIAAALGVVQAIFERGWLGGLIGVQPGPIDAFIPVMVFAIVFGLLETLAQALAERPEGQDALETVRQFILSLHGAEKSDVDEELRLCIKSDETLRSHLRARIAQLEELIAPEIAKDLDAPANDVRPQVVAASLTAAFNVLSEQGGNTKNKAKSAADLAAAIDPVITFLRGGLDALKEPRTTRRR